MKILRLSVLALLLSGTYAFVVQAESRPQGGHAVAQEIPPAILVVDGSGSMWGRIAGEAKISIVKKVLPKTFSALPQGARLGIMAYGHRRKSNCRDIELLTPVQPPGPRQVRAISRLLPRGKTPITGALSRAARKLDIKRAPARIILLSDGTENCRRDPCAMAKKLVRQARDLQIHVVALGLQPGEAAKLQCLARAGGGLFRQVQDAAGLEMALRTVFAALAPQKIKERPQAAAEKKKSEPVKQPPELRLSARLAPDSAPLADGVVWYVGPLRAPREALRRHTEAAPVLKLAPGDYYVEANYGHARVISQVSVKPHGPTDVSLVLNAATLEIASGLGSGASGQEGGAVFAGDGHLILTLERRFADGRIEEIDQRTDAGARYRLAAGTYLVRLQIGRARSQAEISLAPGEVKHLRLDPQVARLRLSAHPAKAAPPLTDVSYQIFRRMKGQASAKPHLLSVARSAEKMPVFYLDPGRYLVVARAGQAEARQEVTLSGGGDKSMQISVPSARLSLRVHLNGRPLPEGLLHTSIHALGERDGGRETRTSGKVFVQSHATRPIFRLPAGRYRVVLRAGRVNVTASRTITLRPGDDQDLAFDLRSATLQPVLRRKIGSVPLRHVFWQVLDETGRELFFTTEPIPRFLLAPGRYLIRAEHNGRMTEKSAIVSEGDKKRLDILPRDRG